MIAGQEEQLDELSIWHTAAQQAVRGERWEEASAALLRVWTISGSLQAGLPRPDRFDTSPGVGLI